MRLAVAHVHYGLRGEESEEDFRFARELAHTHGVPFFSRRITADEREGRRGESLQEWARRLRYEFFATLAQDRWAIALGHHQGDAAETVLMRLARGTSPETLLGMTPWRAPYWRPLLAESKATLGAYLAQHQLAYRLDASNDRLDYSRNVVRHRVLAELESLYPGATARIVACAAQAASRDPATDEIATYVRQTVPTAALSRAFLGEAATRLRHAPGQGRLGPELPGTGLRLGRSADGTLTTEPNALGLKATRAAQHRRGVHGAFQPAALLEPGSHATFRRAHEQWRLDPALAKPAAGPTELRTLPNKPRKHSKLASTPALLLVQDGELLGPYDGTRLILPIDKGICDT